MILSNFGGIFVKHLFLGPVLGSVPNFFVSKNGTDPLWLCLKH